MVSTALLQRRREEKAGDISWIRKCANDAKVFAVPYVLAACAAYDSGNERNGKSDDNPPFRPKAPRMVAQCHHRRAERKEDSDAGQEERAFGEHDSGWDEVAHRRERNDTPAQCKG